MQIQPEHKIFLSYARRDANIVHEVFSIISQRVCGLNVWYDKQDIVGAKDWDLQIFQGLESSTVLLLIASRYSLSSKYVKHELDYFLHTGKPIYVVLIDDTPIDPDLADCPIIDLRSDPLDEDNWYELLNAIRDNDIDRVNTGLKDVTIPHYVKKFTSRLNRLNIFFAGLIILLLSLAQLLSENRRPNLTFILIFLWIFDLSTTFWIPRRIALRQLQEVQLTLLTKQGILRVFAVMFFLSGVTGGPLPSLGEQVPLLSLEGIWGMFMSIISLSLALSFIYIIYKKSFSDVFEFYQYTNDDIKKRFIKETVNGGFTEHFFKFLSLQNIYRSKLVGWLPVSPIKWNFRVQFKPRAGHYYSKEAIYSASKATNALTILYAREDLPLANFLGDKLSSSTRSIQLSSDMNIIGDDTTTYVIVITLYSINSAEAFIEQNPHIHCLPILIQKVQMRIDNLGKLQYVDARNDYHQAIYEIREILDGRRQNIVSGEIEDLRKFAIPSSVIVLYMPSALLLFGSLIILLFPIISWILPAESFIEHDNILPALIFFCVAFLFISVIPLQVIRNGIKRKYSLSTFAIVNTLMMLPMLPLLFVSYPDIFIMLVMLLVMGSMIVIPPIFTILLAWTNVSFGGQFDKPISPRVWSPTKGISWGILSYSVVIVGLIFAIGFAITIANAAVASTDATPAENIPTAPRISTYEGPIKVVDLIIGESYTQTSLGEIYMQGEATQFNSTDHLNGLLTIRYIQIGDPIQFIWYQNGETLAETSISWQRAVDWTEPSNVAQVVSYIEMQDDTNFVPGIYELVVTINDTYLTHTIFTITD